MLHVGTAVSPGVPSRDVLRKADDAETVYPAVRRFAKRLLDEVEPSIVAALELPPDCTGDHVRQLYSDA